MTTADEVLAELRAASDPSRRPGMARVGIRVDDALGVPVPAIRRIARRAGRDQRLAEALWATGVHEARLTAALIAEPARFPWARMQAWARDLDSWDVCDMVADTFAATPHADRAIARWARARHGFTKRCAFSMIARLAVHSDRPDADFETWLETIASESGDDRNEVRKGVNWALRQIGKRNRRLHDAAVATAEAILATGTTSGRWIARDALRELRDPGTVARIDT